jgi:hypothetical protein
MRAVPEDISRQLEGFKPVSKTPFLTSNLTLEKLSSHQLVPSATRPHHLGSTSAPAAPEDDEEETLQQLLGWARRASNRPKPHSQEQEELIARTPGRSRKRHYSDGSRSPRSRRGSTSPGPKDGEEKEPPKLLPEPCHRSHHPSPTSSAPKYENQGLLSRRTSNPPGPRNEEEKDSGAGRSPKRRRVEWEEKKYNENLDGRSRPGGHPRHASPSPASHLGREWCLRCAKLLAITGAGGLYQYHDKRKLRGEGRLTGTHASFQLLHLSHLVAFAGSPC